MGVLKPSEDQIIDAIAKNKRLVNYRWGTAFITSSGRGVSFAWKAWLLAWAFFMGLLWILKVTD